jgi:hypothetical protein
MQEVKMNIDPIIPSILHITAKENVDINADLTAEQIKSIGQLLEEAHEEEKDSQS